MSLRQATKFSPLEQKIAETSISSDESLSILKIQLDRDKIDVGQCREALLSASNNLEERFIAGESANNLVRMRSNLVDHLLIKLWRQHTKSIRTKIALVAVGGYGRAELHPYSDVDLMVLTEAELSDKAKTGISIFFTVLWDIGLDIGHSVRTLTECHQQASTDITTATTLMEARLLVGSKKLFVQMEKTISPTNIWPSDQFFANKRLEQQERHHRYDDTAYKLEPNVKGSPGGLRDIQMIGWVAKRHFGGKTLKELVAHGFLTPGQLKKLQECQEFLWRVRFGLHLLTNRREDRLLFDYQIKLAAMLGYEDASYTLAVEQLMQRYYRTVMELSRLNEILLQQFEEAILMDPEAESQLIDDSFEVRNGYLQTTNDDVFQKDPSTLLKIFLLLQQHENIRGISAYTVGLIRRNLHLIDEQFRQNPRNHRLFLSILRAPAGVTHELRRMNLYGVLGLYIPAFGRIVGRMQYDLFHAYTVDQHTLFVVSNLRRFALKRFDHEHPHCSALMQSFDKPEIVYLAGLFHDIAKGRGGDHSELGAVDGEAFCLEHGLSRYEARTVAWLVRHHLALSMTAQKKDISDPQVINEFAALIRDKTHLDYLYVLTVADVNATSPNLWNSWKATLFRDLYEATAKALRQGLENPIDRELLITETQDSTSKILVDSGLEVRAIEKSWEILTEDYFLRYRPTEIAWHIQVLMNAESNLEDGLLEVRKQVDGDGMEVMLYTPRTRRTFAQNTARLAELGMTILDVRIVPLANGFSLDTYVFMELDHKIEINDRRVDQIRFELLKVIGHKDQTAAQVTRPPPRKVRMFTTKTRVNFEQDALNQRTIMELVAGDRPGLLSMVGRIFVKFDIYIETAKIVTVGERAEDVFYLTDLSGSPLSQKLCESVRNALFESLDN